MELRQAYLAKVGVKRLFEIKGRKRSNPINVLISDISMIDSLARSVSKQERAVMENMFPRCYYYYFRQKARGFRYFNKWL